MATGLAVLDRPDVYHSYDDAQEVDRSAEVESVTAVFSDTSEFDNTYVCWQQIKSIIRRPFSLVENIDDDDPMECSPTYIDDSPAARDIGEDIQEPHGVYSPEYDHPVIFTQTIIVNVDELPELEPQIRPYHRSNL